MATTLTQIPAGQPMTCAMATVQINPEGHPPARDEAQPDNPASQSGGPVH